MDFGQLKPLQERAKELTCIYEIEETLHNSSLEFNEVINRILQIIPNGWQFPSVCSAQIDIDGEIYQLPDCKVSDCFQVAELIVDNNIIGSIKVFYQTIPFQTNPFLPEEQKLLNTIAQTLSQFIFYNRLGGTVKLLSENTENVEGAKYLKSFGDEHWKWRFRMAQTIADKTDFEFYGIEAIYLIGSAKETNAGPASDIDLLVYFTGNDLQLSIFKSWISGWSYSLAELNQQKTGYILDKGIIDLHIITEKEISENGSFAVMIKNPFNQARLLRKK
ncbi:MAG: nucleotidyltransferase domain-containing protein [Bacteroidales bacterium]|jgi:predicted nucleotidyltransferase|nr:nucleotidyltransferase domain-containing protein [Bacteroidales bacterium]